MSGSNTMCAVAGAVAAGLLTPDGPTLDVTIDTAVGLVTARAEICDGRVAAVTVTNVPAYVVALDRPLDVPTVGTVPGGRRLRRPVLRAGRRRRLRRRSWRPDRAASSSGWARCCGSRPASRSTSGIR